MTFGDDRRTSGLRWLSGAAALPLLVAGLASVPALAQTTGGIEGTVSGTSGAALPGTRVEIKSPSLQGTRSAVSRQNGIYWIPAVPPGEYTIKADLAGFRGAIKAAIVTLDATRTVDFTLELIREEQLVVAGEAPLIDTTSTTTGTTYTSRVVTRLPVGRNYADIVRSNPGVNTDLGETQGRSLALTVYGATSVENQWVIDGVNTTNVVKGSQGKAINSEFVQEVEIKTGGYQAEYGRAMGGVINVITKSGGNEFHGDVFGYYDSTTTSAKPLVAANDQIETSMRIAGYERQDVGVDLGGFILKDKLWFFGAYDRVQTPRQVARYTSTALVPDTMEFPLDATDNLYSAKLTWNITSGSTLVATAFADPTTNSGAGGADPRQGRFTIRQILNPDPGTWEADRTIGGTDFGLKLSHLQGASALVTLQGSRHKERYELTPVGAGAAVRLRDFTCEGGTPTTPCQIPTIPNSVIGGFGFVFGSIDHNESHRDQLRGDLTLYLGGHEVKAGGDYQNAVSEAVDSYSGGQVVTRRNELGQLYYQHDFIAVSPTDLTLTDGRTAPRTRDFGAFLQDTWRVAPGWTVSAGLRWDGEDIRDYRGETVIKTTLWQPRLGVVWDPKKDGSLKVYAFGGRFGYALPTDLSIRSYGSETFATTFNFDPVSVGQDPNVIGHSRAFFSGGSFSSPFDSNLKAIYRDELTVGVEKLFDPRFSVGIKATYRRLGNAIEDRCDLDGSRPETNYSYCAIFNPGSGEPIARGALPGCNGLDGDFYACSDTSPAMPPARRLYRGIGDPRPQVVFRQAVAPGLVCLFLPPRELRRRGQRQRPDRPGDQRRLRLPGPPPQQLRKAVPGQATQLGSVSV